MSKEISASATFYVTVSYIIIKFQASQKMQMNKNN